MCKSYVNILDGYESVNIKVPATYTGDIWYGSIHQDYGSSTEGVYYRGGEHTVVLGRE